MKLSIIIPHNNESLNDVDSLFSSINSQIGVNWEDIEIIVSNDSDIILDYSKYSNISHTIKNITSPIKNNPGMNRQNGVDNSCGELIMFCDCDDSLYSCVDINSILIITSENQEADWYKFGILEQNEEDDKLFRINITENIWIYGKVYRRSFIISNNIRFTEKILYSEDLYYTYFMTAYNARTSIVDIPIYIRRTQNENSITRDKTINYQENHTISDHVDASICALSDLNFRNIKLDNLYNLVIPLESFYFAKYLLIYVMLKGSDGARKRAEQKIHEFIMYVDPNLDLCYSYNTPDVIKSMINNEGIDICNYTQNFDEFIERMKNLE